MGELVHTSMFSGYQVYPHKTSLIYTSNFLCFFVSLFDSKYRNSINYLWCFRNTFKTLLTEIRLSRVFNLNGHFSRLYSYIITRTKLYTTPTISMFHITPVSRVNFEYCVLKT